MAKRKRKYRRKLHIWDTIKNMIYTFLTVFVITMLTISATYSTFKSEPVVAQAKESIVDKVKDFMIARGIKAILP